MKRLLLYALLLPTVLCGQITTSPSGGGGTTITDSASLRTALSDENGTGAALFNSATSPTFITPILGTPTSATLTNATGLPVAGLSNLGTGVGTFLITPSSANMLAALTDETGTGAAVFGTSPTLVTPLTNNISSVMGNDFTAQANIPAVSPASSTVGNAATFRASDAVAGVTNAGAAAGGNVTLQSGAAARLTSGNAVSGNIIITTPAAVGSSFAGSIQFVVGNSQKWRVDGAAGAFLAATDNANDIGATGAFRPRDLFLARNAVVGGNVSVAAGTTAIAPITLTAGTNKTTSAAGDIEFDGTNFFQTANTTNSRYVEDQWNFFRLTGSGTGITTIADFFGATGSGIPLVSGGVYEIEWHCYFSQATAGTATWTITTATTALATLTAEYTGSPIGGIGTVGTPQTAAVNVTTSSATAMPVTGTEATAATHYFVIHAICTAGAGASNIRLRLTMGAGTATPLINSYFKVRQLPAANIGAFVN